MLWRLFLDLASLQALLAFVLGPLQKLLRLVAYVRLGYMSLRFLVCIK